MVEFSIVNAMKFLKLADLKGTLPII